MTERRDNSGLIADNDRKEQPNHPDMKGHLTVAGVEYWISGWRKEGTRGPFISLSVRRKDERPAEPRRAPEKPRAQPKRDDDLDDMPF